MIMKICAVYDKKVGAYMVPQFFRTKGEAMRAFMDAVASDAAPFAKHADDYLFCVLGEYDDIGGVLIPIGSSPEILISARDCVLRLTEKADLTLTASQVVTQLGNGRG